MSIRANSDEVFVATGGIVQVTAADVAAKSGFEDVAELLRATA